MTDADALEDLAALIEHKIPYQADLLRNIAAKLRAAARRQGEV